jgi:tripartite-type tricarboxylate transporter receptor subunit TctC
VKVTRALSLSLLIVAVCPAFGFGQDAFPSKTIQIWAGMAPGGTMDTLARALAQEAKKHLGQDVVVVNKPGGTGSTASAQVANAKPDGYTLGLNSSATFTTVPFLQDMSIDLIKENTQIMAFAKFELVIYVKADSPLNSFKDLIEFARKNPGKFSYGSPGAGTRAHLIMAAIALQEGIDISHIPFAGEAPTVSAVLGGHITAGVHSPTGALPHIEAGTLKVIGVTGEERMAGFPKVPTTNELGYSFELPVVALIHGPKNLPEPVQKKLEDAFEKAANSDSFVDISKRHILYLKKHVFGKDLEKFLLVERDKTGELIKKLGGLAK